jgi:hypothetical protein
MRDNKYNSVEIIPHSGVGDSDLHESVSFGRPDPDPHQSKNSGPVEAQNGAMEAMDDNNKGWRLKMEPRKVCRPASL